MDQPSPASARLGGAMLPELPVRPQAARAAIEALGRIAAQAGVQGRVRGFVQPPRRVHIHLWQLATLTAAWAIGSMSPPVAAILALLVGLTAVGQRWGRGPLLPPPPGLLGWNLVLAPWTPQTRVVLAGALDLGARPAGEVELVAALAAVVAVGALGLLSPWLVLSTIGLVLAWVLVAAWRRPFVDIAAMARVAIDTAALRRPELAVVVSSGGAETAAGAWSFLDWWALPPTTRVLWMGDAWGAAALRARGFTVDVVEPKPAAVLALMEGRA